MDVTLFLITVYVVAGVAIVITLNVMQNVKNKKIKKILQNIEVEKNIVDSTPITPELSKIESFLKNDKLEFMYSGWKDKLSEIKDKEIPKISEMLLDCEYSLKQQDYKNTVLKIAKIEVELYKVRTSSEILLDDIKKITTSEEKNRDIITKLKANYRELYSKFIKSKDEFGEMAHTVSLQFENISRKFEDFEDAMEKNDYILVTNIIKVINDMLEHMNVIIEEVPVIVIMATNILPKKINEVMEIYNRMQKKGYPLDYLNIEYNVDEANKKIVDVMDRTRVLNLEDALFELKVLMEYFDSIFVDFEKEKLERSTYEETRNSFNDKLGKLNALVYDIFSKLNELKNLYNLSEEDIIILNKVKEDLKVINEDYKVLVDHTSNSTFAFSKLTREIENLYLRLTGVEDNLSSTLDIIGSMRDDEARAREQLDQIKSILKTSKKYIREYNLPVIPKKYYVELSEAQNAIKEIVVELSKKPITIEVLNTRVNTASDLVFKLFSETKEMMKTAMFAEMAIVYGNRYRSDDIELDNNLEISEELFLKGDYHKSLEVSINALNRVETGIYDKLLALYGKED